MTVTIKMPIKYGNTSLANVPTLTLLKLVTANKHIPTGGVKFPIIMSNVMTTPKLIRSIPNCWAMGTKIGMVMIKMAFPSRKHPRINTMRMIIASMPVEVALMFVNEKMI